MSKIEEEVNFNIIPKEGEAKVSLYEDGKLVQKEETKNFISKNVDYMMEVMMKNIFTGYGDSTNTREINSVSFPGIPSNPIREFVLSSDDRPTNKDRERIAVGTPIGYVYGSYSGSSTTRGSINASESYIRADEAHFVFDFETHCANGTINSLVWTRDKPTPSFSYQRTRNGDSSRDDISGITVMGDYIYRLANNRICKIYKDKDETEVSIDLPPRNYRKYNSKGLTNDGEYIYFFADDVLIKMDKDLKVINHVDEYNQVFNSRRDSKIFTEMSESPRATHLNEDYLFYGGRDTNLYICNRETGERDRVLYDSSGDIVYIYSDELYLYITCVDGFVYIYNISNFHLLKILDDPTGSTIEMKSNKDNIYIPCCDGNLYIYSKETFNLTNEVNLSEYGELWCIDLDHQYIAIGTNSSYLVFIDKESLEVVQDKNLFISEVKRVKLEDNYAYLITYDGYVVQLNTPINEILFTESEEHNIQETTINTDEI